MWRAWGYFAVSGVAHLEVYFRHLIRDLLDKGEPFLGRCDKLLKDGRVNLGSTVAVALSGRRVSFGELIAASLTYSTFGRCAGYLKELLGFDFLEAVRKKYEDEPSPESGTFDDIKRNLVDLYETRHIIAHEVRPQLTLTRERASRWLGAAFSFLFAAGAVMEPVFYPDGVPKTQAEMNERAGESAYRELDRLENAASRLGELLPDFKPALEELSAEWMKWAQRASRVTADMFAEGGTMASALYSQELESLAAAERARLEELVMSLEQMS